MTRRLDDGYQTLIEFAENPAIKLWEKSVTPPGIDGGDAIDTTTMRNTEWRTMAPRALKSLTPFTTNCAYDPAVYPELEAMINVNQVITVTFPDGDTLQFWGWLQTFTPGEMVEGEQPTAEVTITPGNIDDAQAEVGPTHTPAP